ncbi:MAG: ankyrin repeat domain-containing protein [Planctomycetia bacterium]|nr:ankyrin repeat domain-containing protein [Planctomycetia bacterium]
MKQFFAASLVVILVSSGPGVAESNSSLADAAEQHNRAQLAALLKKGADLNAAQADGMTALHWAAHHDDLPLATLLLKAGANAKAANRYGVTPLALACTNGNAEIVTLLLEAGATANTTLRGGETVLMIAARTGKPGPVKALLARGAEVNARDRKERTALMWAAAEGHAEVVSLLLAAKADFKTPLPSGFTPLLFAAREGRLEVVRVLLKAGADINDAIPAGKGVARGPKPGTGALLMAVENGHFEVALALVKAGADPNDQRAGYGALHMISWVRKPSRGDDEEGDPPPIGSGKLTSLEFVKEMVALGAKVDLPSKAGLSGRGILNRPGATPLLAAASTADVALIEMLVKLGADPRLPNAQRTTPLLAAAGVGVGAPEEAAGAEPEVLETVKLLIKLGADVNAVDDNRETAMHGAAYRNHPKVVQLLADQGAKIAVWHKANKSGLTPLVIAEGHRPGLNFRPSPETVAALHRVMIAAGVTPPKSALQPTPKAGYDDGKK